MFSIGRSRFDDDGREFWKWWPGARDRIAWEPPSLRHFTARFESLA